jgi:hypothetical protein
MRTAASLLFVCLALGCTSQQPATPDGHVDATIDAQPDAAGSGSAAAVAMEASPKDRHLDLMVAALCMVIAMTPMRGSQRRRDSL